MFVSLLNQGNGLSVAQKMLINALHSSEADRVDKELLHDKSEKRGTITLEQMLLHILRSSSMSGSVKKMLLINTNNFK